MELEKFSDVFIVCRVMELISWLGSACKLFYLHTSLWNCMQACETVCKLMDLHARSWKCINAHRTACKIMEVH